jgi:hypothetical protein
VTNCAWFGLRIITIGVKVTRVTWVKATQSYPVKFTRVRVLTWVSS